MLNGTTLYHQSAWDTSNCLRARIFLNYMFYLLIYFSVWTGFPFIFPGFSVAFLSCSQFSPCFPLHFPNSLRCVPWWFTVFWSMAQWGPLDFRSRIITAKMFITIPQVHKLRPELQIKSLKMKHAKTCQDTIVDYYESHSTGPGSGKLK